MRRRLAALIWWFILRRKQTVYTPEFVNTLMTPTPVLRVGVFVDSSVSQMIEIARVARLDMVQMHGVYRPEQMQKIREQIPAI